jgi:TusA-related sulfurtransferase
VDLLISSKVLDTLKEGVLLEVRADDLTAQAYVVISAVDMSVVEALVPMSAFESGAQVHVAGVEALGDGTEQVVQVLENMDPGDIVVFLCENAVVYAESLAVLGLKH